MGVEIGGAKLGAYNDGSMPDFFPVRSRRSRDRARSPPPATRRAWTATSATRWSRSSTQELGTEIEIERPDQTVSGVVADRVFFKPEHAEQPLTAN